MLQKSVKSLTVTVSGGAGRIAYALLPILCSGHTFGHAVKIRLRLLDIEQCMEKLQGILMEVEDSTFPLVESISVYSDPAAAFDKCDVAILLGGFPRLKGMERRELLSKNVDIMRSQVTALDQWASADVKVVVIANPANTNCLAALRLSTRIPPQNFSCLTRLDHERLRAAIVAKLNEDLPDAHIGPNDIKNVCIFGNHSTTQVPYATTAQVRIGGAWEPLLNYISQGWILENLVGTIQVRGGVVLKAQQASSGMSAAIAISRHLKDWLGLNPASPADEVFSMGMLSDGNPYGVPPGLIYSFPVRRVAGAAPGAVEIVGGFPISKEYEELLRLTTAELQGEWTDAESLISADKSPATTSS